MEVFSSSRAGSKYSAPKLGGFVIYTIMIAVLIWRLQGLFSRPAAR